MKALLQAVFVLLVAIAPAEAPAEANDDPIATARRFISALQSVLYGESPYPYPQLNDLSTFIAERAIRWVDFDGDGRRELLFWTEGFARDYWPPKENIFVVRVDSKPEEGAVKVGDDYVKIVASRRIFPGIERVTKESPKPRYLSSDFGTFRRKDGSAVAVLTYGYRAMEMTYNKRSSEVEFNEIESDFPIGLGAREPLSALPKDKLQKAWEIIKALQPKIVRRLGGNSNDSNIDLSTAIDPKSIQWVDMVIDKSGDSDLVFWTKGLEEAPQRIYVFVIEVFNDSKKAKYHPSVAQLGEGEYAALYFVRDFRAPGSLDYGSVRFYPFPKKNKAQIKFKNEFHSFLHAVLTFVEGGVQDGNDLYHMLELYYPEEHGLPVIKAIRTAFPAGPRPR